MISRARGLAAAALLAAGILASRSHAASAASNATAKVTGSATCRERTALAPGAIFEATLLDVSRAGAPPEVIGQTRKAAPAFPITFEIPYDPARIDERKTYVVRAAVKEDSRVRCASDEVTPVLTNGHGAKVAIVMRATSSAAGRDAASGAGVSRLPATFLGLLPCADCTGIRYQIDLLPAGAYTQRMTYLRDGHADSFDELGAWSLSGDGRTLTLVGSASGNAFWAVIDARTLRKLDTAGKPIASRLPYELRRLDDAAPIEPRARMLGMFRDQADAARLRECRSGLEWPVAMSDDFRALERDYGAHRPAPGLALQVSVNARIERRPRADGNGTEPTLVVEKFLRSIPDGSCDPPRMPSELANNRWRPVRIADREVSVPDGQREPWIELDARAQRVTGSGGCNRINGTYQAGDGTLRFGALASTRMTCPQMEIETAFLAALEGTRRYRISGRLLDLVDDHGRTLARLEERNLK